MTSFIKKQVEKLNEELQLGIKDIELMEIIAFGAQAVAIKVKWKNDQLVCLKIVNKYDLRFPQLLEYQRVELKILKEMTQNRIKYFPQQFYSKETDEYFIQIMELCQISLQDLVKHLYPSGMEGKLAYCFVKQVVEAVKILHDRNMIHRDIKLGNILLYFENQETYQRIIEQPRNLGDSASSLEQDSLKMINDYLIKEAQLKLIDFGFAKTIIDKTISRAGTIDTMAPEVNEGRAYSFSADIYSIGAVAFQLLFGPDKSAKYFRHDQNGDLIVNEHRELKKFENITKLLVESTKLDPSKRPDINQLKVLLKRENKIEIQSQHSPIQQFKNRHHITIEKNERSLLDYVNSLSNITSDQLERLKVLVVLYLYQEKKENIPTAYSLEQLTIDEDMKISSLSQDKANAQQLHQNSLNPYHQFYHNWVDQTKNSQQQVSKEIVIQTLQVIIDCYHEDHKLQAKS